MYVVKRTDDYLEHARDFKPKYVDKKFINGKWRYYYDLGGNKKSYHNYGGKGSYMKTSGKEGSRYGTYERRRGTDHYYTGRHGVEKYTTYNTDKVTVKKSNRLFSKSKSHQIGSTGSGMNTETIYEEGKLERGHRALNNKLNKGMKSASRSINKHKKRALNKIGNASKKGKSIIDNFVKKYKKSHKKQSSFTYNGKRIY